MPRSWNWRILPLDSYTASCVDVVEGRKPVESLFSNPVNAMYYIRYHATCRKRGCTALAQVLVAYDYITGQAGRESRNEKPHCQKHANQILLTHQNEEEQRPRKKKESSTEI